MKTLLMEFTMIQIDLAFIKDIQYWQVILASAMHHNIGYTEKQLKELNNPHLNRLKKELIRFMLILNVFN